MADVPAPITPKLHDVVLVSTRKLAQARVVGVPPEEFGIERAARSLQDCNYCFHQIVTKTEAELIDEGFDPDQIKAITEFTGLNDIETIERDTVFEHQAITGSSGINPAARICMLTEHYVRMDYEGNGRPGLYQVITGGDQGQVLRKKNDKGKFEDCITKFDVIPFAAATPVPQPHRFFGRSIADLIIELQRQKTAIKRGLLDNMYMILSPRMEVAEANTGPNTLDDLLVARPKGIVRTKTVGGLVPIETQDITASVYPALQYLDAELEAKTGLAKQTQGIDADALQNQSATAVAQVFSASQMRIKLVARIMAEGVKDIFSLLHATIRKHGQQAQTVRLRNQWVNIDPRGWKNRDDMTINVGLGTGGKAQQFAQAMALGNVQKELLMGGKANLVDDKGLYNMAAELTKIMGHKNPDKFFNDPTAKDPQTGQLLHPPVPPPPDPKIQIEQMRQQGQQQQVQIDAYHQQMKAQTDAALAQFKAELDAKLKMMEAALEHRAENQKMVHAERQHGLDVAKSVMSLVQQNQSHGAKMEETGAKQQGDVLQGFLDMQEAHRKSQEQYAKLLIEAVKQANKPKRLVRDKSGRVSHTEVIE